MKKIELQIFLEFKGICDENNINYFIYAVTLLGAVRHNKGLIFWDDDIDILTFRDDYEKCDRCFTRLFFYKIFIQKNIFIIIIVKLEIVGQYLLKELLKI